MISAVVLTKNEEKNIVDCLESLSFCDEIVVIDDNSDDRTVEVVKKLGAKVFKHPLNGDFSKQRNFGLDKVESDWVLFIDADERVNRVLANEIIQKTNENRTDGFFVKREDTIFEKKMIHGELSNVRLLRLAKKGAGKWQGAVHETWIIEGKTGKLRNPLDHFPHQTIREFIEEINYYSTLRSKELLQENVKASWYSIILYPKGKFWMNYVFKLGFLDGIEGFIFAIMMSFHSFLVRAKLWQLNQER